MTERDIFLSALDEQDAAARSAHLDRVCAGKPELRKRIEDLLKSHEKDDTFLEVSVIRQAAEGDGVLGFLAAAGKPDAIGRLDHYDVLEVVGRGATGVVLKARDTKLQRIVAIKVLCPRLAASGAARQRFVREAQAAAAVRDDNVVSIYAVNEEGSAPYLVMEYICGITLEERVKAGPLDLKETLRIGMQLARGLATAHAQGVVHRDVKPGNLLLENGIQRVKITDFGLAGLDNASASTLAGTPSYMSPEQAHGEATDQRTDLFSLGSVLYTLCARRPPFSGDTLGEILRRVREDEPTPLREIKPDIPEWLCELIGKLHAKKACDRFASAHEVAELLSTQLASLQQPLLAAHSAAAQKSSREVSDSLPLELRPWTRRLRLACLAAVLLVLSGICAYVVWRQSQGKDNQSDDEDLRSSGPIELRRDDIPPHLLALAGGGDPAQAPRELAAVLGDGSFLLPRVGQTSWMSQSPDGKVLAVPLDGDVVLFEAASGTYTRELKGPGGRVVWVTFSPDSRLLAATTWFEGWDGSVRVWDLTAGRESFTIPVPGPKVSGAAVFSADGKRLYTEGNERIHVWDAQSGLELGSKAVRPGGISFLCISPDGRRLAAALWQGKRVEIFELDKDRLVDVRALAVQPHPVGAVTFSPDSKYLACGTPGGFKLWNAETFEERRSVETPAVQLAFSPDGHILYAAGTTEAPKPIHTITRWAVDGRGELPALSVEVAVDRAYAHHRLSRDGNVYFIARGDKTTYIQAIATATGKEAYPRQGHVAPLHAVAVGPDGRTVASAGEDWVVKLWDLGTGRVRHVLGGQTDTVFGLAFSPDGKLLASGSRAGVIIVSDARRGTQVRVLQGHARSPSRVRFSPDGRRLAAGSETGMVQTWDVATGEKDVALSGHAGVVRCVAFSADGKLLASGGEDRTVRLHDLAAGSSRKLATAQAVNDLAFSPDGRILAAAGDGPSGAVRFWDLETGHETNLEGHTGHVSGLTFSPSVPVLATCGEDGTVRLWNYARDGAAHVGTIGPGPFGGAVRSIAFTPDGRYLATANANGMVYVLRIEDVR